MKIPHDDSMTISIAMDSHEMPNVRWFSHKDTVYTSELTSAPDIVKFSNEIYEHQEDVLLDTMSEMKYRRVHYFRKTWADKDGHVIMIATYILGVEDLG